MKIELLHTDCMDYMRTLPDKAFDLAVVDPPYGIGVDNMNMLGGGKPPPSTNGFINTRKQRGRLSQGAGKLKDRVLQTMDSSWDAAPPGDYYFTELFRVSKHQIIFGGNYFNLPPTRCVVCWDKMQPWPNFSAWEMAWTSFGMPAKIFRRATVHTEDTGKIHPTQKPMKLYAWLYSLFANPGQRILDTHLGSGSSAIAAHDAGLDFVGCELDADYFNAASERLEKHQQQGRLAL